jgi:sirohydrochlorin ferrochelatase
VSHIVDALQALVPELDVRLASIELVEPDVPTMLAGIPVSRRAVLVPLLLSSGYHDRVDLPAAIAATRPGTAHAPVLGPDPLLAVALADRLVEAGFRPGDAVVLAAAGSSDAGAVASVHEQARLLSFELGTRPAGSAEVATRLADSAESATRLGSAELAARSAATGEVTTAFGSAATPDVVTAVAAARAAGADRVAIATYLLAPGFFADRLASAGADVVAAPLGAHPAVLELILRRAAAASTSD